MRFVSVASARPNFVKLAAVHHALARTSGAEHVIVHTGQHYDPLFSDLFFEQLDIDEPAVNLGIAGSTREEQITRVREELLAMLPRLRPDVLIVYGDVNGAAGAAMAASALRIPIAHVEAGLRSFDPAMPEEHNRIAVDKVAQYLFCTEDAAVENLRKEGVQGQVHLVGNTMIDTLLRMLPLIRKQDPPRPLPELYAVCTLHRPSNVDDPDALRRNVEFLNEVASAMPIVLPVHHRLRMRLAEFGLMDALSPNVLMTEALPYLAFLRTVRDAAFILTDSGGIQEEAVVMRKRCFTLRKNTERPVTILSGSNTLLDLDKPEDRGEILRFARHPQTPQITVPPLWDGKAGERIVKVLRG